MTIGSSDYLTSDVKEAFTLSGITHILVVSGSNIAFLIVFLNFFLKYLPVGRTGRIILIGGIIAFYSSLVGWDVAIARAVIMGVLSFLFAEYGSQGSSIALFGLSFLILTFISPLAPVYDVAFGLSFSATFGILFISSSIRNFCSKTKIPPTLITILSISIGASLGSLPVMIASF